MSGSTRVRRTNCRFSAFRLIVKAAKIYKISHMAYPHLLGYEQCPVTFGMPFHAKMHEYRQ